MEFKFNRRHQDFVKSKIEKNHSNQNIFGGGKFFFGGGIQIRLGGKIFRPTEMLVFAMVIVFLTFLGLGIKFSRWGENLPGGHK